MNAEMKAMEQLPAGKNKNQLFEKLKTHAELIAAIVSGVFILAGWVLEKLDFSSVSIASSRR